MVPKSALTIPALDAGGAVLLIVLVVVLGRAAGLGLEPAVAELQTAARQKRSRNQLKMATVPDLVGKTEEEAKTLANDAKLGVQMAGEEASDQEKGRISSGDCCGNKG